MKGEFEDMFDLHLKKVNLLWMVGIGAVLFLGLRLGLSRPMWLAMYIHLYGTGLYYLFGFKWRRGRLAQIKTANRREYLKYKEKNK